MLPYEGVIRKRLRLKGHPEIPQYRDDSASAEVPSASAPCAELQPQPPAARGEGGGVEEDEITPVGGGTGKGGESDDDNENEAATKRDDKACVKEEIEASAARDVRTETERRHDDAGLAREKALLRKEASKSYREKVDVCYMLLAFLFDCLVLSLLSSDLFCVLVLFV